jgi:hypothetical protein
MGEGRKLRLPARIAFSAVGVAIAVASVAAGCGDDGGSGLHCIADLSMDSGPSFDPQVCIDAGEVMTPAECPPGCRAVA